jgi:hypothetical protein
MSDRSARAVGVVVGVMVLATMVFFVVGIPLLPPS